MVIINEEENILKIRKINEIRGYSANLNILEKIIIWTIIVFLTLFFQTFIIGSGNGIDKLNFWTSDNVKFLMFCTNIIFYIIISLVDILIFYLINGINTSRKMLMFQIFVIYVHLAIMEFGSRTIWYSFGRCNSMIDYVMFVFMLFNLIFATYMCVNIYRKCKICKS